MPPPSHSLASVLSAPVGNYKAKNGAGSSASTASSNAGTSARRYAHVPPFAQRRAGGFVPRTQRDFGGGGAYPEIHVSQFPRDMGRPARRDSFLADHFSRFGRACTAMA